MLSAKKIRLRSLPTHSRLRSLPTHTTYDPLHFSQIYKRTQHLIINNNNNNNRHLSNILLFWNARRINIWCMNQGRRKTEKKLYFSSCLYLFFELKWLTHRGDDKIWPRIEDDNGLDHFSISDLYLVILLGMLNWKFIIKTNLGPKAWSLISYSK